MDGSDPARPQPIERLTDTHEERRDKRTHRVAGGTLACPECDAPVAPVGTMAPTDPLGCPVCLHSARVRDFLSLTQPTRPAHVDVNVVMRIDRRRRVRVQPRANP
jgi:hypothetical protein